MSGTSGSTGSTGAAGGTGTSGSSGTTGTSGASGTSGATGATGAPGEGSSGTTGATGATGSTGAPGTDGTSGSTGASGATGATGAPGSDGTQGATGSSGSTGTTGAPGSQGSSGSSGATGATGAAGSSILNGGCSATEPSANCVSSIFGFMYFCNNDGRVFSCSDGSWVLLDDLSGPSGPSGASGPGAEAASDFTWRNLIMGSSVISSAVAPACFEDVLGDVHLRGQTTFQAQLIGDVQYQLLAALPKTASGSCTCTPGDNDVIITTSATTQPTTNTFVGFPWDACLVRLRVSRDVPADINQDGVVNSADVEAIESSQFFSNETGVGSLCIGPCGRVDLNNDGAVDPNDVDALNNAIPIPTDVSCGAIYATVYSCGGDIPRGGAFDISLDNVDYYNNDGSVVAKRSLHSQRSDEIIVMIEKTKEDLEKKASREDLEKVSQQTREDLEKKASREDLDKLRSEILMNQSPRSAVDDVMVSKLKEEVSMLSEHLKRQKEEMQEEISQLKSLLQVSSKSSNLLSSRTILFAGIGGMIVVVFAVVFVISLITRKRQY